MKLEEVKEDLKLGDVVELRSGGKKMTVTHIEEKKTGVVYVECTWFEGPYADQKLQNSTFPCEALKKDAVAPKVIKPDSSMIIPVTWNLLVAPFSEAKAKEVQKAVAKSLQKEVEEKADLGKDVKLEMVLIPAGTFRMGSPESEEDRDDDETQHEVTLTKPFYLGTYTVTQEQWEAVMGNNPSEVKEARLPVTDVSWENCQEFVKKLNEKTNGGYRFPTEAEWEYACRAGTTTAYSVGDNITPNDANYRDSHIFEPVEVGGYEPNAFGLYDMHGNVWEWCEDWYGDYPAGSVTDPKGPSTGESRVLRGGSFFINESLARSSIRNLITPSIRYDFDYGFRLARTVDLNEDLDLDEVLVYDPLNLSEEEEKERANFIPRGER